MELIHRARIALQPVARWHPGLVLSLAAGIALKGVLLLSGSITFDADEAVVALMARHIAQGARPVFFYGQNYMGALDAYLVAGAFRLLGERVMTVRLVQTVLFAAVIVTNYMVSLKLSDSRWAASIAAVLVAVPPVLVGLYTTATLGEYVEILMLGNLLLLIGWRMAESREGGPAWLWALWGFLAGLGWWSMALVVVTAVPVAVYVIRQHLGQPPGGKVALSVGSAIVGAAPWLWQTIRQGPGATIGDAAGVWITPEFLGSLLETWPQRIFNLVTFNFAALIGLRPPWSVEWILPLVGIPLAALYLLALWSGLRRNVGSPESARRLTILAGWLLLATLFVVTPFGRDPTGRYLLPLYPLLAVLVADWMLSWRQRQVWSVALVLALVGYNLWGTVRSMRRNPPGLTTQFDPISVIPEDHDAELLAFLDQIGVHHAYTNYWVTYRFAFETGEQVNFAPRLPYKLDMSYTPDDNRIPAYSDAVDASEEVVYITTNHPQLDSRLAERFRVLGVTFREKQIGPYHVFYDVSRPVRPSELGPFVIN